MGVGEDDRRWTPVERWTAEQPQVCGVCKDRLDGRELGYGPVMCERAGCPGPTDRVSVEVVPASVVDELRGEVERLRSALEEIRSSDPIDNALDPDRNRRLAHLALDAPDGYATHTTEATEPCPERCYENTRLTIDGPTRVAGVICGRCSGSGRVPVVSLEQEDNR